MEEESKEMKNGKVNEEEEEEEEKEKEEREAIVMEEEEEEEEKEEIRTMAIANSWLETGPGEEGEQKEEENVTNQKMEEEEKEEEKEEKMETEEDKEQETKTPKREERKKREQEQEKEIVTKSGRKIHKPKQETAVTENKKSKDMEPPAQRTATPSQEELEQKQEEFEKDNHPEHQLGTVLWARVGSSPFWPAAVVNDPDLGMSTHVAYKMAKFYREYHVQFYGKAVQRAWVGPNCILKFQGLEEFNKRAAEYKESAKSKEKKKLLKAYFPSGKTKTSWEEAIQGERGQQTLYS